MTGKSESCVHSILTIKGYRHCNCVYYQEWHRTRRPKPAAEGALLPAVSQTVSTTRPTGNAPGAGFTSPRDTLASASGIVVAVNDMLPNSPVASLPAPAAQSTAGLPFDEEAKLVYGVVLSLRNMIKRLSGRYDCSPPLFLWIYARYRLETNSS